MNKLVKLSKWLLTGSLFFSVLTALIQPISINANKEIKALSLSSDQIDISVEIEYINKSNANVNLIASEKNKEVKILSIKDPSLEVHIKNALTYAVIQNGTYVFWVNYSLNGISSVQEFYIDIYGLTTNSIEGERPSYETGWLPAGDISTKKLRSSTGDQPSGKIFVKGIPIQVEVDGQTFSPNHSAMIAFMKDENGNGLMCMEPHKFAAGEVVAYKTIKPYEDMEPVMGKDSTRIPAGQMALDWYFGAVYLPKKSTTHKLSETEWYLITQLQLWEKLGYRYDQTKLDSRLMAAIGAIDYEVSKHNDRLVAGNNLKILTYVDEKDIVGTWQPFEDNTQLSFNDPTVAKDKVIKIQVPKVLSADLQTNWNKKTPGINMSYSYGTTEDVYSFKLIGDIEADKTSVPFSIIPESIQGNPWFLDGSQSAGNFQSLMSFKVPEARSKKINFQFEPITYTGVPGEPITPPTITPPTFTKVDLEDGFPVQGAEFEFRASENFKMKWLVETKKLVNTEFTPAVPCSNNPDTGVCEGGSPSYTTYTYEIEDAKPSTTPGGIYKPVGIFSESNHLFGNWTTDANGNIDLTPIVNDITAAVETHKTESASLNEPASWGDLVTIDDRIPSNELKYYYVDTEFFFENGKFNFSEPETSQNIFNDNALNMGDTDYVGYYNDYPTRKTSFTISSSGSNDITVENERQKGRITVHKTDNENNYLNQNNSHEPQGDGFFSGAKFDIVAAEDIILHDGTVVHQQGDIVESIITDESGTATTELLELGQYTVQEVRLPGSYETLTDDAKMLLDGGYWFQNYNNGIDNPLTIKVEKGGQIINIDIEYTGQDNSYNEHVPSCYSPGDSGSNVTVNGEAVIHTIPYEEIMDDMNIVENNALDYANSIQKGHVQLRKYISEVPGDNGQADQIGSANVQDVYFAIYLNSKPNENMIEPLPDSYFTQKRLDGKVYTFDSNGNFYRNTKDEILFKENGEVVLDLKGWKNPTMLISSTSSITSHNLNEKNLYMVLKTNSLGNAGTNIPETIVYANKAVVANTGTQGSYGAYDYANPNKLLASGLPLPYGQYTILELNPYEGYYPVSYQIEVSKDTKDINGVVTDLGIETGIQATDTLRKQFYIFVDRLVASTIKDDLIRQNIEVTKRDVETGKVIPASNTAFKIWQWNTAFKLEESHIRKEWVKDTLVIDEHGNYVCLDEFTVCTYADGKPNEATIKKEMLPTFDEATNEQRDNGTYQHWKIYYVEYQQVPNDPLMPNSPTHTEVQFYDENNNFTQTRESDGKIISEPVGQWVTRTYTQPDSYGKTTRLVYTTNAEGQFTLPEGAPLIYGDYLLCEINAPYGYTISSTPTEFSIEHLGGTVEPNEPIEIITIQLDQVNLPQKGAVNIVKRGDVLQGFEKYTTLLGFDAWRPVYEEAEIQDVTVFAVYASEDIIVNNDVKFAKDTLVDTIYTDDYGNGSSAELYLGKYRVIEKQAPEGYITDGTPIDFELTYKGQNVQIYPVYESQVNVRQRPKFVINKTLSNGQIANDIYFALKTNQEFETGEVVHVSNPDSVDPGFSVPERPEVPGLIETDQIPLANDDADFTMDVSGIITAYNGTSTTPIIPAEINGEAILGLADNVFDGKGLTVITLPLSLQTIGKEALANNSLTSIEFFDWYYEDGIAKELMINIDSSWINYNPTLEKIIVPAGNKVDFDTLLDKDADDSMNYIPLIEKKIVEFIDPGMTVPTFPDSQTKSDVLPIGTLLEVIQIHNGVGMSTLDYPEGEYYLEEIKAPSNVIMSNEIYPVTFKFDETLGNTQTIPVNNGYPIMNETTDTPDVPDRPTPPTPNKKDIILDIQMIKSLEQDKLFGNIQAYKDVLFGVYAGEDMLDKKGNIIYTKDELVFESGIDEKGDFLDVMSTANMDIPEGKYYVQEIKTSADYILDSTKYPFEYENVKNQFYYTLELNTGNPISNELKRTHIIVYKVDRQETTKTLPGATFTLFDQDMQILEVITTGKDGIARFENLPDGKYFVQETETPVGYTPSNEIKEVNIVGAQTKESKNNEYVIQWTNVLLPMYYEETGREIKETNLTWILLNIVGVAYLLYRRNQSSI